MDDLIKAVRSLINDIEAMRIENTEIFATFEEWGSNADGGVEIEWPNLAISLDNAKEILTKLEQGPVIEGELNIIRPVIEAAKALCSSITEEEVMDTPMNMVPKLIDLGQAVQDLEAHEETISKKQGEIPGSFDDAIRLIMKEVRKAIAEDTSLEDGIRAVLFPLLVGYGSTKGGQ